VVRKFYQKQLGKKLELFEVGLSISQGFFDHAWSGSAGRMEDVNTIPA